MHWNWLLVEREHFTSISGIYLFFEPPVPLNSVQQRRTWDVYNCLAHHPTVSGTKTSLHCSQYSATGPEIQQNESSPSHCAVFWHSSSMNQISQNVLLFHFLFLNFVCAYHISHVCYKLRPFHLPCFDHSHTVMSRSSSFCNPLQPGNPKSIWGPIFFQTFLFVLTGKLGEAVTFSARRSVWPLVSTAIILTRITSFFTFPLDSASNYATVVSFPVFPISLFPNHTPPPFDTMDPKFEMLTA